MTREEALSKVKGYLTDLLPSEEYDEVEEIIRALEQTGWISIGERLPNCDEYIKNNGLFIVSDGNRSYSEWYDIYDKRRFGEPTMSGFRVDYAVTHWMSLPDPYQTESEE